MTNKFTLLLLLFLGLSSFACDAPSNLTAIVEENVPGYQYRFKVTVSWDVVENAESYIVYVNGNLFGVTSTNLYYAGSDYETTVTFTVIANCMDNTTSDFSEPLTVVVGPQNDDCTPPENIAAEVEQNVPGYQHLYKVTLSWDLVDNADSYSVYINGDHLIDVTENSYVVGFDYVVEVTFNVSSNCGSEESDLSEPVIVVTGDPCIPPTNINAILQQDLPDFDHLYKVTLSWDEMDNANSYTIYANGTWIGYATTTNYIVGYDEECTVTYTITSSCELGESEHSEPITVIIQNDAMTEYENYFELYPNPVNNNLVINTAEKINDVEIFNIVGILVLKVEENNYNNIDVSNLNGGMYFVKITTKRGEIVKRFIKE